MQGLSGSRAFANADDWTQSTSSRIEVVDTDLAGEGLRAKGLAIPCGDPQAMILMLASTRQDPGQCLHELCFGTAPTRGQGGGAQLPVVAWSHRHDLNLARVRQSEGGNKWGTMRVVLNSLPVWSRFDTTSTTTTNRFQTK
jgi:hypothetical protein